MARTLKIRAHEIDGQVIVKSVINHPMETGNRLGSDGAKIPIHYIKFVNFSVNGELAGTLNLGPGVSADPYLSLDITGAVSGDKVSLHWEDNKGETDTVETTVK